MIFSYKIDEQISGMKYWLAPGFHRYNREVSGPTKADSRKGHKILYLGSNKYTGSHCNKLICIM
jgi:hypothetical protein